MKRRTLVLLISSLVLVLIVLVSGILIWLEVSPRTTTVELEVTLAKPVTQTIGNVQYTFRLYPYNQEGIYLLRVERDKEFKTLAVVQGHTYRFLDLEVYVKKLVPAGIQITVKRI